MSQGERRLAAVMFTDMVGYTALTQSDEGQSLAVLERHNRLLRPIFSRFHGREVKTIGDSFLVEFGSALDATDCAVEIQQFLHDYNISSKDEWKLTLRIGIHLGDVVRSGDDILGDAVNVASRIQPLAQPGGVCVSEQVYDQVRNKIPQALIKLDPQDLKGIKFAIDVYKVVMPWEKGVADIAPQMDSKRIAVLPFVNMSPDPDDEFFADGMTEELISAVSNIAKLQVVSRTSAMHFKKTTKTMGEIAKELGVGSILEGSVRKAGDKVRIAVQLIDSTKDAHVWARTYDRQFQDVFAIQSDISVNIAESLKVSLFDNERERLFKEPTNDPEAHLLYMKGRHFWNERTKDSLERAVGYFERAIEKDPSYAIAYSGLADVYSILVDHGYMPRSIGHDLALRNAEKAVALDANLSEAHASLGLVLSDDRNSPRAAEELRRAIALNPNNAYAHMWLSLIAVDPRDSISSAEKAAKLDPLNLQIGSTLGSNYYRSLRFADAIYQLRKVTELDPKFPPPHLWLALTYLASGRLEEAMVEARIANELADRRLFLGIILAFAGRREEAQAIVDELEKTNVYMDPADLAWLYLGLRRQDKAISWLERAVKENSAHLSYFAEDPSSREFRRDPGVIALLAKAGYPAQ